jgi:hypothetical protein
MVSATRVVVITEGLRLCARAMSCACVEPILLTYAQLQLCPRDNSDSAQLRRKQLPTRSHAAPSRLNLCAGVCRLRRLTARPITRVNEIAARRASSPRVRPEHWNPLRHCKSDGRALADARPASHSTRNCVARASSTGASLAEVTHPAQMKGAVAEQTQAT